MCVVNFSQMTSPSDAFVWPTKNLPWQWTQYIFSLTQIALSQRWALILESVFRFFENIAKSNFRAFFVCDHKIRSTFCQNYHLFPIQSEDFRNRPSAHRKRIFFFFFIWVRIPPRIYLIAFWGKNRRHTKLYVIITHLHYNQNASWTGVCFNDWLMVADVERTTTVNQCGRHSSDDFDYIYIWCVDNTRKKKNMLKLDYGIYKWKPMTKRNH